MGVNVDGLEKIPVPEVVQFRERYAVALAVETVKVDPSQILLSVPAFDVAAGIKVRMNKSDTAPLQGVKGCTVRVRFTCPAAISAALAV